MKTIDVFAAARAAAVREGRIPLAKLPRLAASLVGGRAAIGDGIAFHCAALIDGHGRPALHLTIEAVLPLRCDRCGQAIDWPLAAERDFYFVATEAELAALAIDTSDEEALLGSANFDLAGLIEDEAILQLPISPRHAHCSLAGIGTPARTGTGAGAEDGEQDRTRRPFAVLAGLREQLQEKSLPAPEKAAGTVRAPRKPRPGSR